MGDIVSSIFGGGQQQQQSTSSSGFGSLPPALQSAISSLVSSGGNLLNSGGTANSSIDRLPTLNSGTQAAQTALENQNYAITPQSIASGITEQMNPYNNSVIGEIQQQQNGNLSQLNSYLTDAGDFGSNRGALGANDISNTQANEVGSFLNGEYNTALGNALTTIPQEGLTSAGASLGAGVQQQGQQLQNQQAPVTALQQLASLFGVIPATSTSTGASNGNQNQSLFSSQNTSNIGGLLSTGQGALAGLSGLLGGGSALSSLGSAGAALFA